MVSIAMDSILLLVFKDYGQEIYDYISDILKSWMIVMRIIQMNVAFFMQKICGKLKTLHDNDIVFCDLKPENICCDEYINAIDGIDDYGIIDYECCVGNNSKFDFIFGTNYIEHQK